MYNETREKQVNYYLKLSGAVLMLIATIVIIVVSGALSHYLDANSGDKTITVSGYAEMNATPDIRTLSVSIMGKGATEKLAQEDASVKSNEVSATLNEDKISNDDRKSQNLSTYPDYKNDCPPTIYGAYRPCNTSSVVSGYITTQTIEVTLRKDTMDKAAQILADLTNKGITVQTGEATVENPEKLQADLRAKAISNARANAEKLADALGVHLGKVASFNENSGGYYPMAAKMEAQTMSAVQDSATPPVISNGTQKISSTVSVSFEIR